MNFFKKILKTFIFILGIGVFLLLVDFKNLSFRTVVPQKDSRIEVSESIGAGVVRNVKNSSLEQDFQGNEQNIIDLVNEARKEAGLKEVKANEKLTLSAMDKALHMRDHGYFDHVSPQGLQPWYFAQKREYEYKTFGENLAEGYFSAETVHEGWMDSEGHRENILSSDFNEVGVAILEFQQEGPVLPDGSRDKQKSYLAVQHFGSRLMPQDLITKIVCDKKSKENCEDAEDEEERIEDLIKEQKNIIKKAKEAGAGQKDLNRLENNLDELKDAEDELEDYLDECEEYLAKCDSFK